MRALGEGKGIRGSFSIWTFVPGQKSCTAGGGFGLHPSLSTHPVVSPLRHVASRPQHFRQSFATSRERSTTWLVAGEAGIIYESRAGRISRRENSRRRKNNVPRDGNIESMQLCSFSASSLLFLSSRVTDPGKKKIRPREKTFSPHHSETYSPRETCWFVVKIDQKYMYPSTRAGFLDEKIAKIFKISTIRIIRFNFFKTSKFNFIPFLFIPLDRQLFSRLLHISKSFSSRCNYALSLPPLSSSFLPASQIPEKENPSREKTFSPRHSWNLLVRRKYRPKIYVSFHVHGLPRWKDRKDF